MIEARCDVHLTFTSLDARRQLEPLSVDFIFADDSKQAKPSRLCAGNFVAIGGVHVLGSDVGPLERALEKLCIASGFPPGEQFKWSPGAKEPFMRSKLVGHLRADFYRRLFDTVAKFAITACVVVVDSNYKAAVDSSSSAEHDATALFLERASHALRAANSDGVVVIAMPSGGAAEGQRFVANCIGLIEAGTEYHSFRNLPLGVFAAQSRQVRLLQLADVITSCTVARVSGEVVYSPDVFDRIKPLFRRSAERVGGVGLKLHPEFVYQNLYYWLLGDTHYWRDGTSRPLPDRFRPFAEHPNESLVAAELAREGRNNRSEAQSRRLP